MYSIHEFRSTYIVHVNSHFIRDLFRYCGKLPYSAGCDGTRSVIAVHASLRPTLPATGAIAPPKSSVWSRNII